MEIYKYSFQPIDSKMYILIENSAALIIDPCIDEDAFTLLKSKNICDVWIMLTHEHYDHISGVNEYKKRYSCKVICSKKCAKNIQNIAMNQSRYFSILLMNKNSKGNIGYLGGPYSCEATEYFTNEMEINWQGHVFQMRETPGHSEGSICILLDGKYLFTGDTLIKGEKIITKLKGGSIEHYRASTKPFLMECDSKVYVYPGHGDSGVIREFTITE